MRLSVWIAVGLLALYARRASAEPPDPRDEVVLIDDVDVTAEVVKPYLSESSDALALLAQADGDPPAVPTGLEPGLYWEPAQSSAQAPESPPAAAEPSTPTVVPAAPAAGEQTAEGGRPKPDPVFAEWGEPGADATPIEQRIHAAVMFGVGASFDETPAGVNPLGFGFGLRGDYRLLPELAVGARFLYYVGGSAALPAGDISMSSWLLAAEAAYGFPIHGMLLEPGLVLGISARTVDGRAPFVDGRAGGFVTGNEDRTDVGFYLAPGASLAIPLAIFSPDLEPFFVGGDARIGFVFADEVSGSFELMAQAGLRF
jgi:hypothetical protein